MQNVECKRENDERAVRAQMASAASKSEGTADAFGPEVRRDIVNRTHRFAVRILKMVRNLLCDTAAQVVTRQVCRSGTSVGSNVEEAQAAQTKKEFTRKMNIAFAEARETHYWLRLLKDAEIASPERMGSIIDEADELRRILAAIVRSSSK